ncbi:1-acyl-sn-glycerol-3-phosphate acyltransferase [Aromatoleum evansii]|uniref:1-acyl-sn-glycerol-3-phosphate acyltransferase n=1 Tax=Aromatoleum evansii TaxID=59406 RepID=A0ABZ1AFM0_AROEV|nr:1-acyl-sn-glycerol-3-phosphate acyltransferase [Aromatoleum evansii]NMG28172.1 glycerol acyltransferase [Aromatoleum evansii]WRL44672.1 1-acyl-sn-glycerol-3-phosphate acyltransferase [Aromatoleum evansii]
MLARLLLRLAGWRVVLVPPPGPKGVVMVYPHTSNWDFPIGVLARSASGLRISYVAKDSLFRPPFGALFRWLGGIPVNRRVSTGFVGQLVRRFAESESLLIAIAPEGTRGHVPHLKSGFYHLALEAGVPLGLVLIDYDRCEAGIGAWVTLTGDVERDLAVIREFYAGRRGKHPEKAGEIRFRDGQG